jgi:enoyl-CoA hydratase/carnithine racemase
LSTTQTTFETHGPLAILTFNRPEARNAMTWTMYEALRDACDRIDRDSDLRVLILKGAGGKAFISGTDIAQFESFKTPDDAVQYELRMDTVLDRLERVTKPTIAQVQGVAAGGGCAIALCCDLRVATPDSTFGVPVSRTLGNCLSGDTCNRMLSLMGPARFKELMFTGRFIHAPEAQTLGLVNRMVDAGDIDQVVRELAAEIASRAPLTIRAIKEMTRRLLARQRLPPGEDRDLIEMCYMSADFREGVAAFMAKRPPQWTGR